MPLRSRWRSAGVRATAALGVLFALRLTANEGAERARLHVEAMLALPCAAFRRAAAEGDALADPAARALLDLLIADRAARRASSDTLLTLPVFDWRPDKGVLVVGGGQDAGLERGDAVVAAGAFVGSVEAVERHLATVRVVSAPGARTAVMLAESRPGLPGHLNALHAVLVVSADGSCALTEGALLESFRVGDRLVTAGGTAAGLHGIPGGLLMGTVTEPGPRPLVAAAMGAAVPEFVQIVGRDAEERRGLFAAGSAAVVAAPARATGGFVVTGPAVADAAAGCAVSHGDAYLGRLSRVAGDVALAVGLDDPGHEVLVQWLADDGTAGRSVFATVGPGRMAARAGATLPPTGRIAAVTAGGRDLVAPDLVVGVFTLTDGVASREGPAPGLPGEASLHVFLAADEWARLTAGGRR